MNEVTAQDGKILGGDRALCGAAPTGEHFSPQGERGRGPKCWRDEAAGEGYIFTAKPKLHTPSIQAIAVHL